LRAAQNIRDATLTIAMAVGIRIGVAGGTSGERVLLTVQSSNPPDTRQCK